MKNKFKIVNLNNLIIGIVYRYKNGKKKTLKLYASGSLEF
tara:strand:+ start:651 stop:770 length:120 start_codon:yes stop_codon:yes gene_type:complete